MKNRSSRPARDTRIPPAQPRTRHLSRIEKAEITRRHLFDAAVEIVGELGYAETSIVNITQRAGVGQGTFYNYFETRQDLLDQLLPAISQELMNHVRDAVRQARTPVARERARLTAFFSFLEKAPHLFKILDEGPVHAPEGFRKHLELQTESYRRALRYEFDHGFLRITDLDELEVVTQILLSSRQYLSARFCFVEGTFKRPPDFVVEAYMKMVEGFLFAPRAFDGADIPPVPSQVLK